MKVLRFVWNLILALLLAALIALVLTTGLALVAARTWENAGLDDGSQGATWLWIAGQPIYYQVQGQEGNPPVVLVHGDYVEGSQTWSQNATALSRNGRRVITVDLRGYGRSERDPGAVYSVRQQAELLATVLNTLQVQGATVVAHDWGCAVALQMAVDQPQFSQRLVLIAPTLERDAEPVWQWALKMPYLRTAALWVRRGGGPLQTLERKALYANPSVVNAAYLKTMRAPTHVVGTMAALESMATERDDSDLPDALGQVQAPVLVLLGEQDPSVAPDLVAKWSSRLPAVETQTLTNAGHFIQEEQSSAVNRVIIAISE
jgi:4,5:9,10-diseco-3-hydroxy-5,9,17-trioxoandrosta-1(10),2-diene-4-oate hydrolase